MAAARGIVLFGDVVDSRLDPPRATAFLRSLRRELETSYPREERLAGFGFTQGDELQGLLAPGVNPFLAVLRAGLRADAPGLRWVVVAGPVERGTGPATERSGSAFLIARSLVGRAKAQRDGLLAQTGDPEIDALLEDLAPLLPVLISDLTDRQREVARLIVVEGLRRSDVAERLDVSRATVSVLADRARVRDLERLARALAALFATGERRAMAEGTAA
ncbi:MAG: sigma factor-like helix-turn-helix DNA-binding protein [Chloroflexota bacterium]